ncbi:MAG TPA: metal-dependent hydrolase [Burkholderiales bacterium]|nr:metal-dependent hydrolase [Burkholderiales bacterium]
MPTFVSHALTMITAGALVRARRRAIVVAIACATLPDLDVIAYSFGVHWDSMLGHRGITHTLVFALALGPLAAWLGFPAAPLRERLWLAAAFAAATFSHAILDAFTNGGLGIPFFWPLDDTRYFMPWQPLEVSPFLGGFFSARGLEVAASEFLWIGLPCAAVLATLALLRRRR